jgi:aldehyde dehydrogenase (NAD+)
VAGRAGIFCCAAGNGREYGREGLEEYLETKAILGYYD